MGNGRENSFYQRTISLSCLIDPLMQKIPNTIDNIILEMKFIQLQLYLAKKSAKDIYTLQSTLSKVEQHIENSLRSINHLISNINDYKQIQ